MRREGREECAREAERGNGSVRISFPETPSPHAAAPVGGGSPERGGEGGGSRREAAKMVCEWRGEPIQYGPLG